MNFSTTFKFIEMHLYLGKGEPLTNTDLDRFVNNIREIGLLCT